METPGRNEPLQTKMYSELKITITADQLDSQWYFPLLPQWVFTIVHISNHYVFAREWIKPNCTWIKTWFILSVLLTQFWIFLNLLLTNTKLQAVCDRSEHKGAEAPFLCQLPLPAAGAVVPSPNGCTGVQGLSSHVTFGIVGTACTWVPPLSCFNLGCSKHGTFRSFLPLPLTPEYRDFCFAFFFQGDLQYFL